MKHISHENGLQLKVDSNWSIFYFYYQRFEEPNLVLILYFVMPEFILKTNPL